MKIDAPRVAPCVPQRIVSRAPNCQFFGLFSGYPAAGRRKLITVQPAALNGREYRLFQTHTDNSAELLGFQLIEQPPERIDNSSRLDAQRDLDSSMRLVTRANGSDHSDGEEMVPLQPFATLLQEARRVSFGILRGV